MEPDGPRILPMEAAYTSSVKKCVRTRQQLYKKNIRMARQDFWRYDEGRFLVLDCFLTFGLLKKGFVPFHPMEVNFYFMKTNDRPRECRSGISQH